MIRRNFSAITIALCLLASFATAAPLPADEQAFIDKHIADFITFTPKRLSDPAITKTFSAPIYEITVTINQGDGGSQSQQQIAARADNKLVPVSRPSSDADCPSMLKLINADFKLNTDDDAKTFQSALDVLYPTFSPDDKKAVAFHHANHEWTFIRGVFFDKKLGFVVTTDDKGKIAGVKFSLKIP